MADCFTIFEVFVEIVWEASEARWRADVDADEAGRSSLLEMADSEELVGVGDGKVEG